MFFEDPAALIGTAIATLCVSLRHAFNNHYFDPQASMLIGLVLIGTAFLLARESGGLLIRESTDRNQIMQLRNTIAADSAVESVRHPLTMHLEPDSVLLAIAVRFERRLNLD